MTVNQEPRNLRGEVEAWWPLVARMSGFFFGMFLIYNEQQPPPGTEEWIMIAAIGCMGPTVATTVAIVIEAVRGSTRGGGDA